MENETKLSSEKINSIMKEVSQGDKDPQQLISEHLDESSAAKLRSILNDPQKLRSIMESPLAKKLFAAMSGNKNGE